MSRPVKNLRFMGTASPGARAKNATPKGTGNKPGALTTVNGRKPIAPVWEKQSKPGFDGPTVFLNKYDGH